MFVTTHSVAGMQPINDWFSPDTTQRHPLGFVVDAFSPAFGQGRFIYIQSNDAILKGSLVAWDKDHKGVLLPSTAGQGFPFGVAIAPMASGTFGWIQVGGQAVYKTNATVAADTAVAVAAAGIVGTLANGKQLCGVRNVVAATGTITVTATTKNNSHILRTNGYGKFTLGLALSGTGIPASTVVAKLDEDGRTIYMGSAIGTVGDKLATADGSITLTGTYTGFGVGILQSPFAQGQVV